jgi:hypothetical protein
MVGLNLENITERLAETFGHANHNSVLVVFTHALGNNVPHCILVSFISFRPAFESVLEERRVTFDVAGNGPELSHTKVIFKRAPGLYDVNPSNVLSRRILHRPEPDFPKRSI